VPVIAEKYKEKMDGRVEQKENNPFPPPRQSVRAVFPHTAFL